MRIILAFGTLLTYSYVWRNVGRITQALAWKSYHWRSSSRWSIKSISHMALIQLEYQLNLYLGELFFFISPLSKCAHGTVFNGRLRFLFGSNPTPYIHITSKNKLAFILLINRIEQNRTFNRSRCWLPYQQFFDWLLWRRKFSLTTTCEIFNRVIPLQWTSAVSSDFKALKVE